MRENITLTLPSGLEAELRSYVRRKDEKRVNNVLMGQSVDVPMSGTSGTSNYELKMDMTKIADMDDMQILTLLIRLGDKTELTMDDVEELTLEDYEVLLDKTNEIFGDKKLTAQTDRSKK